MKHINIKVKGKVQGVYFRASTKAVADQVGANGFVVNLKDGSVYIEAEGDRFSLDALVEFCHEGPDDAVIESVEVEEIVELKGFKNFEILKRI